MPHSVAVARSPRASHQRAIAALVLAALCAAASADTGGSAAPLITYGTGPTCYPHGMICEGPATVARRCCSGQNLTCTAIASRKFKYCLPDNKICIGTDSPCKPKGKACCDPYDVCIDNPNPGIEGIVSKRCEKKCTPDNKRCAGDDNMPYVKFKVRPIQQWGIPSLSLRFTSLPFVSLL
jgi:hypothetical protein